MSTDAITVEAKPLAIREEVPPPSLFGAMTPAEKLAYGKEVATVLKGMLLEGKIKIDKNGNEVRVPLIVRVPQWKDGAIIGYSEHVEVEGWQTCAMLCNSTIIPRWAKLDGNGYDAYAEVQTFDGRVIGGGQGRCDRTEKSWSHKPAFQLESMSQTRAQSKAGRSVFAWIMVLAGFSATPAEEVPREGFNAPPNAPPPKPEPKPKPKTKAKQKDDGRRARIFALVGEYAAVAPEAAKVLQDDPDHKEDPGHLRHGIYKKLFGDNHPDLETIHLDDLETGEVDTLSTMIRQRIREHQPGERK